MERLKSYIFAFSLILAGSSLQFSKPLIHNTTELSYAVILAIVLFLISCEIHDKEDEIIDCSNFRPDNML
jgi:hypothetical protein